MDNLDSSNSDNFLRGEENGDMKTKLGQMLSCPYCLTFWLVLIVVTVVTLKGFYNARNGNR